LCSVMAMDVHVYVHTYFTTYVLAPYLLHVHTYVHL
jgi:hypothetical protein